MSCRTVDPTANTTRRWLPQQSQPLGDTKEVVAADILAISLVHQLDKSSAGTQSRPINQSINIHERWTRKFRQQCDNNTLANSRTEQESLPSEPRPPLRCWRCCLFDHPVNHCHETMAVKGLQLLLMVPKQKIQPSQMTHLNSTLNKTMKSMIFLS
jgi:hypothetical protein